MDSHYLEVSRPAMRGRGFLLFMGGLMLVWLVGSNIGPDSLLCARGVPDFLIGMGGNLVAIWGMLLAIKLSVCLPRDLPLRFNRSRQRIYAYNYHYSWWNPFGWRVEAVAYDWSQVRAERWKMRATTVKGALIIKMGVVLSIVAPGTNKVIDRFPLSTMDVDENVWAYVCTYMQQGPEALPPPGPPLDHNDVVGVSLALWLAPAVKWPADMDLESRTAPPHSGIQPCAVGDQQPLTKEIGSDAD